MTQYILISLIFCTNLLVSSCALNRAKSSKMLEVRAAYKDAKEDELKMGQKGDAFTPIQRPAKRVKVYVYPHQLPNGDYFLGGHIFAEVEKEKVILNAGGN